MTAHIIRFPSRAHAAPAPAADEPAALSRETAFDQPFHYWRGASGRRYLHTVFPLVDCPEMPKANYILVRREASGLRRALAIGQTVAEAKSLNLAHLRHRGARLGANEIHMHLLAETAGDRDRVEADLRAARLAWIAAEAPPSISATG